MLKLAASQISSASVVGSPFPHIYFERCFPNSIYTAMIENLPSIELYRNQWHRDAMLAEGKSARRSFELCAENIGRLPAARRDFWSSFMRDLERYQMGSRLKEKFEQVLRDRFDLDIENLELRQRAVLFKDFSGYKISVHTDSPKKVFTSQFYLPRDESDLQLGTVLHERLVNGQFRDARRLPFRPNCGYAFAVSRDSWHSVQGVPPSSQERNSLALLYYVRRLHVGRKKRIRYWSRYHRDRFLYWSQFQQRVWPKSWGPNWV